MTVASVVRESRADLDLFLRLVLDAETKEKILVEVREYLATHPINDSSARLTSIRIQEPIETMKDDVRGYINARGNRDDYPILNHNQWWIQEDDDELSIFWNNVTIDPALKDYVLDIAARYLVVHEYNPLMQLLRDALMPNVDNYAELIREYIVKRQDELRNERRNDMVTRNSFTMEDCLNSHIAIIVRPISLNEVLEMQAKVNAECYKPKKIATIREFIANHSIEKPIELLGGLTWEGVGIDDINNGVQRYVDVFKQNNDYSLCERTAESGEGLIALAKDVMSELRQDPRINAEWMQHRIAMYLTNTYTTTTTFWLRAALLVDDYKSAEFAKKYIEDKRFNFPNYQNELEEILGLNVDNSTNEKKEVVMNNENEQVVAPVASDVDATEISNDGLVTTCAWCGEVISIDHAHGINRDEELCDDCFERARRCADCGNWFPEDELTETVRGDFVCEDCLDDHYVKCHECGEWVDRDDGCYSDIEDEWYCERHYYDRFTHCEDCNCEIYCDDTYYDEYDNGPYCESCYYDYHCKSSVIYDYHDFSSGDYEVMMAPNEQPRNQATFGIELEVAGDCDDAEEFLDIMGNDVHLEYDSTVDGFEIITHPMTRQYFEEMFKPKLEEGLRFLRNRGFEGHGEGGMHVHFTRVVNRAQLMRMIRVLYGDLTSTEVWEQISQRGKNNMNWCKLTSRCVRTEDILNGNGYNADSTDNHHTGLNYDEHRTGTHELRIFNSTVRFDRFVKNMEVVFSLLDYTSMGGKNIRVDVFSYLDYVRAHKDDYPMFHDFMTEKELWKFNQELTDEQCKNDSADVVDAFKLPHQLTMDLDGYIPIPDIKDDPVVEQLVEEIFAEI